MIALRRVEKLAYAALGAIAIASACAKAEDSPLADQGGDDEGNGGGKGGTAAQGGTSGAGVTGGSAGKGGTTSTGGSAGKGGTTSTGGKGGSTSTGGSAGKAATTYGCIDEGGAGGEGGQGGVPGQAGAGGGGNETLFSDDFEDGDANGWTPTSGSWSIASDDSEAYEQSDAGSTSQYISAIADTCWADQVVEARVKIVSFNGNSTSNAAGLFARYVSAQTHYLVGMNSGNNGELFIARRIQSSSNSPDRIARKTNMRWATNTWYTLRLEVVGSSLKAYLDDVLQLEVTDTQITSGGVAVGARHVNVLFDDVRVTRP